MLQIEPLHSLLEEKWHTFARPIFWFKFVVYVVYLIIFTIVAYLRKEGEVRLHPFLLSRQNIISDYSGTVQSSNVFQHISSVSFLATVSH